MVKTVRNNPVLPKMVERMLRMWSFGRGFTCIILVSQKVTTQRRGEGGGVKGRGLVKKRTEGIKEAIR